MMYYLGLIFSFYRFYIKIFWAVGCQFVSCCKGEEEEEEKVEGERDRERGKEKEKKGRRQRRRRQNKAV